MYASSRLAKGSVHHSMTGGNSNSTLIIIQLLIVWIPLKVTFLYACIDQGICRTLLIASAKHINLGCVVHQY